MLKVATDLNSFELNMLRLNMLESCLRQTVNLLLNYIIVSWRSFVLKKVPWWCIQRCSDRSSVLINYAIAKSSSADTCVM